MIKNTIKKFIPKRIFKYYFQARRKFRNIPADEKIKFDVTSIYIGHFQVRYRGVECVRCPFDYVMYQMILDEIKPDLVIEIGTNKGGTTLYMADLMDKIGKGEIHTIDIKDEACDMTRNHPRVKLFKEGWVGYDKSNAKGFEKVLVIEDSSHTYEDSLGALQKFHDLVSVGSYFIVEDGIVSNLGREKGFGGGPLKAIREFMAANSSYIVDRKYCDMFGKNATFNVNGYLKRIR